MRLKDVYQAIGKSSYAGDLMKYIQSRVDWDVWEDDMFEQLVLTAWKLNLLDVTN